MQGKKKEHESSEWSEIALNSSLEAVIWVSKMGLIEKCNKAFYNFSGISEKELSNFSLFDLGENLSKSNGQLFGRKFKKQNL